MKEVLPVSVRLQVRREQLNICAVCGETTHLTIHHKIPRSHGGTDERSNLIGVCREPCHDVLDKLALEESIYYDQIMQEGKLYDLREYAVGNRSEFLLK